MAKATLDGNDTRRVLRISAGTVTLGDLLISGGSLVDPGTGIFNLVLGTLTLNGSTSVSGNVSGTVGGGIADADPNHLLTTEASGRGPVFGPALLVSGSVPPWTTPAAGWVDALGETAARELLDAITRSDADRAALIGRLP